MAKLTWDNPSERLFETGVSRGVLYVQNFDGSYADGVAWNGLVSVTDKHTGGDPVHLYAGGQPYVNIYDFEEFEATIEAYTYPDEFMECEGFYSDAASEDALIVSLQDRKRFGFCYTSIIGNDIEGTDYHYRIHIFYDCVAAPSEKEFQTINDSSEITTFSWDITTYPVDISGYDQSPMVTIDSRKTTRTTMRKIERQLFGTVDDPPRLIDAREIVSFLGSHYLLTDDFDNIVIGGDRILV